MSEVPYPISDCVESLRKRILSHSHRPVFVRRIHTVLLVQKASGSQPMEGVRVEGLRGLESRSSSRLRHIRGNRSGSQCDTCCVGLRRRPTYGRSQATMDV